MVNGTGKVMFDTLYEGTKRLWAKPMTRGEYNAYRGWETPAGEEEADEGYIVEYTDGGKPNMDGHLGYVSWSPKDVFERTYRNVDAQPSGIHPAPVQFSGEQLATDPILRYFHYSHLPPVLQAASKPFCGLASHIVTTLPRNAERTVALRKLLEAKDAAVRANVT